MNQIKSILLLSIFATPILSACTTTKEIQNNLRVSWVGKNTDQFFIRYGIPTNSIKLNNGDSLFGYNNSESVTIPSTTTTNAVSGPSGQIAVYSTTTPSSEIASECNLQITASPNGIIKNIEIRKDSLGLWKLSRCDEVFGS